MGLRWNDLDLDRNALHLDDTKNNNPLDIPLSSYISGLLRERKARIGGTWVFPSNSRSGHITNTFHFCRELGEMGIRVYPHLLRKFFTTIAAGLIPGPMVDCLTGHVPGGVTGRHYAAPTVGQLRPYTETVTAEILRLSGISYRELRLT